MKFILSKHKPYFFATLLSIICFSEEANSQVDVIGLHKKYWYYKSRLNNDFIKIGNDFYGYGQSIPFNQRAVYYAPESGDPYVGPSDGMHSGDGSAQLGIYLSILATEYKLLINQGADPSKVNHEIFCALNAINRLDYFAENHIDSHPHPDNPNSTSGPDLNGFFVLDDFHSDFIRENYWHFNYFNNNSNFFGGQGPVPPNYVQVYVKP